MSKTYTCRDVGVDCDWKTEADTEDALMANIQAHAAETAAAKLRKYVPKPIPRDAHGVIQYDSYEGTEVEFRGFGIDMTYVAEGPFYVGSDGTELNSFYTYTKDGLRSPPYRIKDPGAIPTGRQPGRLWARKGAQPEDGGEVPASFPNGYTAFYCI